MKEELTEQQKTAEDFIDELIDSGRIQQALGASMLCAKLHLLTEKQSHRIAFRKVPDKEAE
jgi:hypothetical protein